MRRFLMLSFALLLCLGGLFVPESAKAQPRSAEEVPDHQTIHYRAHLVPEGEVGERIRGVDELEVMKRADFDRMIQEINERSSTELPEAQIQHGVYTARLEEDQLVGGTARIEIARPSAETAPLSLRPLQLPIEKLRWVEPATSPVRAGCNAAGEPWLLAEGDALQFSWSLRGERDESGGLQFSTSLPRSPMNQLVLFLPAGTVPRAEAAIVTALSADQVGQYLPEAVSPPEVELRPWLFELGGRSSLKFTISEQEAAEQDPPLLQESLSYQFTEAGIELHVRFSLDVTGRPLNQLVLDVDRPLRIATARLGDKRLTVHRGAGGRTATLQLSEPLRGAGREISVTALAPLVMDEPWELPRIQARQVIWQAGRSTLRLPSTLVLQRLQPRGYIQTDVEPLPSSRAGELWTFQAYEENASIEAAIGYPPSRVQIDSGVAVRFGDSKMTAQVVADVTATQSEQFVLHAERSGNWIVDSVEAEPSEAMAEYDFSGPRRRQLSIRLARPVSPNNPVRLVIQASRGLPARNSYRGEELRPLEFRGAIAQRRIVSLHADTPYRLSLANDAQVNRLNAAELPPEQADRLATPPGALVYRDGPEAKEMLLRIGTEKPRYSAQLEIETLVDHEHIEERYRIQCEPESTQVSHLQVHFSHRHEQPLSWLLNGESQGVVSAKEVTEAADLSRGATWDILLQPQVEPFELQAVRTRGLDGATPVSLVSVPEATSQSGTLQFASVPDSRLSISAPSLQAIPVPPAPAGKYPEVRARYRYDPSSDAAVTVEQKGISQQLPAAWVWLCRVAARAQRGGEIEHEAVLQLENAGRQEISITLPEDIDLHRVTVDGSPRLDLRRSSGTITVPLPSGKRFCTIRLNYFVQTAPLRDLGTVQTVWPQVNVPCLERVWSVWLPPGYEALSDQRIVPRFRPPRARWDERLFGVRLVRDFSRPFNLFSGDDWAQLFGRESDTSPAVHIARTFRTQIAELVSAEAELTWGELVREYAQVQRSGQSDGLPPLWIDSAALAQCGVAPQSRVRTTQRRSAADPGILDADQLGLVVGPNVVLLTSAANLPEFGGPNTRLAGQTTVVVAPSDSLTEVLPEGKIPLSPARWSASGGARVLPPSLSSDSMGASGWTNYELQVGQGPRTKLWIRSVSLAQVTQWSLALIAAGVALWFFGASSRALFVVVCLAAAVALAVPADLMLVGRGFFLGTLTAYGLCAVRRPGIGVSLLDSSGGLSSRYRLEAMMPHAVVLFALVWGTGDWLQADEQPEVQAADKPVPVYPVYIPVDDQRQPTGDVVYVPRPLHDALHRREALAQHTSYGWLLQSASYELQLEQDVETEALRANQLIATYELWVDRGDARVRLPLRQADVSLLEARSDENRVASRWSSNGEHLELEVTSAGRTRLELRLRPEVQTQEETAGFTARIPQVAASRLAVTGAPGADKIQLRSALGAVTRGADADGAALVADLGPTGQLELHWPTRAAADEDDRPDAEVTQLLSVLVEPASVEVDTRFTFSAGSEPLQQVRLLTDNRLKLQSFSEDEAIAGYEVLQGERQTIQVELDREYSSGSEVTLEASFVVDRRSGLGNVLVPRLEADVEVAARTWLGLSSASELEVSLSAGEDVQPISPVEFAEAWGAEDRAPDDAWQVSADDSPGMLAVQPRVPQTEVQDESTYTIRREQLMLRYQAQVETERGDRFQHRLNLSPSLQVKQVRASQDGENRVLRWSIDNGQLTIFFRSPVSGSYEVEVYGEMPIGLRQEFALPLVSWDQAERTGGTLQIYRGTDTLVNLRDVSGLGQRSVASKQTNAVSRDRHVAAYEDGGSDGASRSLRVQIRPNRPQSRGTLVTALSYVDQHWYLEAELSVRSWGGIQDSLRLHVPGDLAEPLEFEPELPYRMETIPGSSRRVITIRFPEGADRQMKVRMHARVSSQPNAQIRVPTLEVPDVSDLRRLLILPTKVGEQQLAWETSGLQEIPVPAQYAERQPSSVTVTAYRQVSESMDASVRDVEQVTGAPQVHLADYYLAWRQDGTCYGVATFDLQPSRLRECELQMPSDCELIHATVAGVPPLVESVGDRRWRLRLGPDQLPQRVEVIFKGVVRGSPDARHHASLLAPHLVDLPVQQTLWTVCGPPSSGVQPLLRHTQTVLASQDELRIDHIDSMLGLSSDVAARTSPNEFEIWEAMWNRRRQRTADGGLPDGSRGSQSRSEEARKGSGSAQRGEPSGVVDHAATWREVASRRSPPAFFQMRGESPSFVMQLQQDRFSQIIRGTAFAGACLLVAGLGLLVTCSSTFREWASCWPHLVGVLAGLAYWLWMRPSVVGLIVALVMLLSTARSPWRLRRLG